MMIQWPGCFNYTLYSVEHNNGTQFIVGRYNAHCGLQGPKRCELRHILIIFPWKMKSWMDLHGHMWKVFNYQVK